MKFSLITLGCKVNQSESDTIENALTSAGHEVIPLSPETDVCIVNTCTVTARSDYESRQYIRRALKSGARVVATGCYSQLFRNEILKISPLVRVIDNDKKTSIISEFCNNIESSSFNVGTTRSRAFVKIQDGCNFGCSYCSIPMARGKSRSRDPGEILDEILALEAGGYREIVLTGIHIGLYGHDLRPATDLAALARRVIEESGMARIRLSSLEINEISGELLDLLGHERICRHLHIPLQSGDDAILARMNRSYTTARYAERMEEIAGRVPGISIGTDVITGFPGEDEKSFRNTLSFIESMPFSYLHVFPYSVRKNTAAAGMDGQVDRATKKRRASALREVSRRKREKYMEGLVGRTLDVIVEDRLEGGGYSSTAGNYMKVTIDAERLIPGSLVYTAITAMSGDTLRGIPVNSLQPADFIEKI